MSRYRRSLTEGATYFFTVNLADGNSRLLIEHIDRLRDAYRVVTKRHPFQTIAICVLPDHLHAIWQLPDGDANFGFRWSLIKRHFSTGLTATNHVAASKVAKREKGIWRRRFWEHQIRDELDLQRHVDYIHFNPVKHRHVERVIDWEHSSFHRYVKEVTLSPLWGGTHADEVHGFGE